MPCQQRTNSHCVTIRSEHHLSSCWHWWWQLATTIHFVCFLLLSPNQQSQMISAKSSSNPLPHNSLPIKFHPTEFSKYLGSSQTEKKNYTHEIYSMSRLRFRPSIMHHCHIIFFIKHIIIIIYFVQNQSTYMLMPQWCLLLAYEKNYGWIIADLPTHAIQQLKIMLMHCQESIQGIPHN